MQVLVADDDPVYRTLLKEMLSGWDYEVVLACDGQEAWEALQQENPAHLIILDWLMPVMDGFELCKKIRAGRMSDHTYILLMTSSNQKEEIIKVLVAGADDYLIKPFEPLDLKIRLRTAQRILDLQEELADRMRPANVQAL